MRCIRLVKIFIIVFTLSFALLQQLIFVFAKYIYMMLTLSKRSCNSFDILNKKIFTYSEWETIAKKKERKLKIKSVYIFISTIIIEHALIVDAFYYELLQWMTRSLYLYELYFIYNCDVDELANWWRLHYK